MNLSSNTLLFSIATNGYDEIYRDYLRSHKSYAERYGYKYIAFTKSPPEGISGTNSAWLKIALILKALRKGYKSVFFIDADALINETTPPIERIFESQKFIYMSVESTGRFNSGVIIVRNHEKAIRFFRHLLLRSDIPNALLPKEDRNLYENGHVINLAKNSPIVKVISSKWNYNYDSVLEEGETEYILHGRGTWQRKPRSKTKGLTKLEALVKRLEEGPRYFILKRLLAFYVNEYSF